jgi:hypothetical protein
MPARPFVFVNPRDDVVFQRVVETLTGTCESPEQLQDALRTSYPTAVVRARDLSSERDTVWYAYRDGQWTPSG